MTKKKTAKTHVVLAAHRAQAGLDVHGAQGLHLRRPPPAPNLSGTRALSSAYLSLSVTPRCPIAANAECRCRNKRRSAKSAASRSPPLPFPTARSGLSQNTAALLSYVLGWFTGLIFFLIDKRPYVRFHAAQSIITFGGLHIAKSILGMALGVGWWTGGCSTLTVG